jgi:hypothetical protein
MSLKYLVLYLHLYQILLKQLTQPDTLEATRARTFILDKYLYLKKVFLLKDLRNPLQQIYLFNALLELQLHLYKEFLSLMLFYFFL